MMRDPSGDGLVAQHLQRVAQVIGGIDAGEVRKLADSVDRKATTGGHIFFIGNGGSAATATHYVNDLVMAYFRSGMAVRATSLTDNTSLLTGVSNDYSYEEVFCVQLKALSSRGDMVIAISASGNSPNLVRAIEYGNDSGLETVAITAFDGGALKASAQLSVHVPTKNGEYGPAEDAHLVINHALATYIRSLHAP